MTANSDFKQVVRERMAETGETYTQARRALISSTVTRVKALLTEFAETPRDRIDREHLIIEAVNLLATIEVSVIDDETAQGLFWLCPADSRMEIVDQFLNRDDVSNINQAWAYEHRLRLMTMDDKYSAAEVVSAHEEFFDWAVKHLSEQDQAGVFSVPEVWWCWEQEDRGAEIWSRMASCMASIPAAQDNRTDRLFLVRNLVMQAARQKNREDVTLWHGAMRIIIDEPGEIASQSSGGDGRLQWEGIWHMTPLLAAFEDTGDVAQAAETCAAWIRSQRGAVDSLLGEIAAICMFNSHYALAERYAEEALAAGQGKLNSLIYVWRAGGHLGETGDVATTLPLLREARRHNSAKEIKRMLSQQVPFTEYADDARLQEVVLTD